MMNNLPDDEAFEQVLTELAESFHETKHKVKNSLAVILAMAELSQRNHNYSAKLVSSVVGKTPEMVEQLELFSQRLNHLARVAKNRKR